MIFAVSMLFVDQTIVAIAIPKIESGLALSATGAQWVINGYLLALAALFAFGGKLTDVVGHRRMVIVGVIGFAAASALCGAAPAGRAGECVADRVSRRPGRVRGGAVPGGARDRRQHLRAG